MHPVRPLRSLFHPGVFLSILGQAAIHLGCMVYAVRIAKDAMGESKLAEVMEFNKMVKAGEEIDFEEYDNADPMEEFWNMWSKPFLPNLLNTTVFLVETAQIIAVLFVNYKGRPWMKGILENHALVLSIFLCLAGVGIAAWELFPWANAMLHLEPFPSDEYRWTVMGLVAMTTAGSFLFDRVITFLFARSIFDAMASEAKKTSLADIMPIVNTLVKIGGGLLVFLSGNPIVWVGAFYFYRKYRASNDQAKLDAEALGVKV